MADNDLDRKIREFGELYPGSRSPPPSYSPPISHSYEKPREPGGCLIVTVGIAMMIGCGIISDMACPRKTPEEIARESKMVKEKEAERLYGIAKNRYEAGDYRAAEMVIEQSLEVDNAPFKSHWLHTKILWKK